MTDNFRPVNDEYRNEFLERAQAHGLGPEQPQIKQFLRAHYGDAVPNAQSEVA